MTTDITELAQQELAQLRAELSNQAIGSKDHLRKLALLLVEALEKAQQVDEELCKLLPPGAEYMDPPDGGDVTPLEGVRRMVADYRQRIAELESRTVKLPEPEQWDITQVLLCKKKVVAAIRAAGIKVEAE